MDQISKNNLRKVFTRRRKQYITSGKHNYNHWAVRQNLHHLLSGKGNIRVIGSYINVTDKQLIPPIISEEHIAHAYPVFTYKDRKMEFIKHTPGSKYKIGDFGIKVRTQWGVQDILTEKLDAVLVPLTCFTIAKDRIGYGGGYYDNFIGEKRNKKGQKMPLFIGIGAETLKYQGQTHEIFGQWDQKLDYIITEQKIY